MNKHERECVPVNAFISYLKSISFAQVIVLCPNQNPLIGDALEYFRHLSSGGLVDHIRDTQDRISFLTQFGKGYPGASWCMSPSLFADLPAEYHEAAKLVGAVVTRGVLGTDG
jgi:hypothetical protein